MKGSLYVITNQINNKKYVGKTYKSLDDRMSEHIRDSRKERCKNRPLYRAFQKYGIENFEIKLLGEFEEGLLEDKEIEFIEKYNSYANGYNATLGGDGKRYFQYSDMEVIEAYSKLKTIKSTANYFNCDIDTVKKILINNNIELNKASIIHERKANVAIVDTDLVFESVYELARYLQLNKIIVGVSENRIREGINRVLNGTRKTYHHMKFKLLD